VSPVRNVLRKAFCHFACAQLQVANFGGAKLDQFVLPKEVFVSLCSEDQRTMIEELTFHRIDALRLYGDSSQILGKLYDY
jgi:hypothetical protein